MSFFGDMKKSIQAEIGEDSKIKTASNETSQGEQIDQGKTGEPLTHEDNRKSSNTPTNYDLDNINIDDLLSNAPVNEKGNKIVPDDVFDRYYKLLPNGTRNETGNKMTVNGGILRPFGADPEYDKKIQKAGAEALNAERAHRQSMADTLDILLRQPADPETIDTLNLPAGATKQDALLAAMYRQATEGNVKAGQFVRDTIGEQPTTKQDINVGMTDEDRRLLDNIERRLNE